MVVATVDAIQAKAKTAHVELALREMLYTRRVVDVAEYLMAESGLQLAAALVEELELVGGEGVKVVAVGTHEMGEH